MQSSQGEETNQVAEAKPKIEGIPTWEEISEEVKKTAGYVKVSKEMIEDLSFVQGEINNDLTRAMTDQIENQLMNGSGTGSDLTGLLSPAMGLPAFNPGNFAGTILNANHSDVIRVAKAQIEGQNYTPTHIVMHPEAVASLQLTKRS